MSTVPSDIDRLFSKATINNIPNQHYTLAEEEANSSPIIFRGNQLFSKTSTSCPPGFSPSPPNAHSTTNDQIRINSKFALPPPGFPLNPISSITEPLNDELPLENKLGPIVKDAPIDYPAQPNNSQRFKFTSIYKSNENIPVAKPFWLMTDREIRYIWRISMTPVISALCKSPEDVNMIHQTSLFGNSNLHLSKEGKIHYPEDYSGEDFYFAQFQNRSTNAEHLLKTPENLLAFYSQQQRPGRKIPKASISNEMHLKSILPHVPKLATRSEKTVDGALGKISLNSLRRPKQSISIESIANPSMSHTTDTSYSKAASLSVAEQLYKKLISADGEQFILSIVSDPQVLLSLVQTPKGRRLIPQMLSVLSPTSSVSRLTLFQTILCNLCLFLSSSANNSFISKNYLKDNDNAAVECILTPFVTFLSQLSIPELFGLCEKIAFQPGLSQVITASKIPYMVLCIIYSQIEHHLQNDTHNMKAFEEVWNQTSECLFGSLSLSLPAMLSNTIYLQTEDDLFYAWQFLALLSAHISISKCHNLIDILRDAILSAANSDIPESVRNVNLLLNMVGLDASQLACHK